MEIRTPEQTSQGQTGTHSRIMKILGMLFKIKKRKKKRVVTSWKKNLLLGASVGAGVYPKLVVKRHN